jgi:ribosomal protein S18 acetylase RimI-like enzyme
MPASIRPARPEDLDAMVELLQSLFAIEADFCAQESLQRKGLTLMLDGCLKHKCVLVAEARGQVVGMATAQSLISTAEGGLVALVEDVVVAATCRGRGIGRMLMQGIENWAMSRGASRLQLLADRSNHSALDFYYAIGWQPTQLICLRRKWKDNPAST